jgi:hypothetical protein
MKKITLRLRERQLAIGYRKYRSRHQNQTWQPKGLNNAKSDSPFQQEKTYTYHAITYSITHLHDRSYSQRRLYQTRWIEDDQLVLFVKNSPTYKTRFINVFETDHENNWSGYLENQERQYAIDFCKYYLGFNTPMHTMNDFYECKQVYLSTASHELPASV